MTKGFRLMTEKAGKTKDDDADVLLSRLGGREEVSRAEEVGLSVAAQTGVEWSGVAHQGREVHNCSLDVGK
jgi:hypothetical protein